MTKQEKMRIEIEGYLYTSESTYAVIVQDDGKSVLVDDMLHRYPFITKRVRLILEVIQNV